jgi:hypothetical protein
MNRCIRVAASFLRKISWPAGLEVVGYQVVESSALEAEEVFGASLHFVPNVLGYRPLRALRGRRREAFRSRLEEGAIRPTSMPRVNDGRHYGEIRRKGDSRKRFDTHDASIRSM